MTRMMRRSRRYLGSAGVLLAALCVISAPTFAQGQNPEPTRDGPHLAVPVEGGKVSVAIAGDFDKVDVLPPGGPAPRLADGHIDLSGRWYPNRAGRMLQVAYPVPVEAFFHFDRDKEERPVFMPGRDEKYRRPALDEPGECRQAGVPDTLLVQANDHAPMELIHLPGGKLWQMFEYPMDVRLIHADGRPHLEDPDPSFNGDAVARWEGDTLVIDTIGITTDMRNRESGDWFHSEQQRVIERITRTSKNHLTYEVIIEDPVVLAKPWKSEPRQWSLAQDPNDYWTEFFCTHNYEPEEYKKIYRDTAPNQR